jgi:hypothetical protein
MTRLLSAIGRLIKKSVIGALAAAGLVFLLFVIDLLFNGGEIEPVDEPLDEPVA